MPGIRRKPQLRMCPWLLVPRLEHVKLQGSRERGLRGYNKASHAKRQRQCQTVKPRKKAIYQSINYFFLSSLAFADIFLPKNKSIRHWGRIGVSSSCSSIEVLKSHLSLSQPPQK